ncbi:STAS domain-containing protein [Hymenobacter sp. UYP22]|uniref:STAS domain-containing protein n=1 Tax=Hymenobacter sp. UYP22 TaxID=3156348 RepID=UPI00339ACDA7
MMRQLVVHTSGYSSSCGLSLRGSCATLTDVQVLENAIRQVLRPSCRQFWVDCRQLEALSYQGQRAFLWADNQARAVGVTLYWCGLPANLLTQLNESGLALLLHLLPAISYQGPAELLA